MAKLGVALLSIVLSALLFYQVHRSSQKLQWVQDEHPNIQIWIEWKNRHQRMYNTPHEELYRLQVFFRNAQRVAYLNAAGDSAVYELNHLADMSEEEFRSKMTGLKFKEGDFSTEGTQRYRELPDLKDIPTSFDWRDQNVVTPVKDQQRCGSCWAFSTTGNLEGLYALKNQQLKSFSEQMLVDCSTSYGNDGCNGGLPTQAVKYIIDSGIQQESDYPYVAVNMMCQPKFEGWYWKDVKSQVQIPKNNNDVLLQSATIEPISICIDAQILQFYKSGIISQNCGQTINHAVLLVGWGQEADPKEQGQVVNTWLVKNSWGTKWGEDGYFKVKRLSGVTPSPCAIPSLASYALTTSQ